MSPSRPRDNKRKEAFYSLAQAIKGPRAVVAVVFDDLFKRRRVTTSLDAVARHAIDDTDAYLRALVRADQLRSLKRFCEALLNANAVDTTSFDTRARDLLGGGGAVPEGTYDAYDTAQDPGVDGARKLRAIPHLCRIDIDGVSKGTGFLVASHLVLTCYHVVSDLIANGKERSGSSERLSIVFDDRRELRDNVTIRLQTVPVGVPSNWLVDSSKCLAIEQLGPKSDAYVKKIKIGLGPWDYALIRLDKVVNLACTGLPLGTLSPMKQERIVVYHHPGGNTLVSTDGSVHSLMGDGVRFKHTANTKGGSSGAPCFNRDYEVVGLHQAGPKTKSLKVPNRAVPVCRFRDKIVSKLGDPSPEMKPILALDDGKVVIGRDDTQQWIWRAIPNGRAAPGSFSSKILVVKGAKGRGKKFTVEILRTLLADGAHMIADLDVGNMVEDTPLTFAGKILASLTADGTQLPSNPGLTTYLNWLKLTLMPATRKAIDEVRNGRTVWVVFRYPEDGILPETSKIRDALDAFYVQAGQVEWLRLVLLGLQVDVPDEIAEATAIENLRLAGSADVATYFQRRWREPGARDVAELDAIAGFIVQEVGDQNEASYHENLVKRVRAWDQHLAKSLKKR